MNIWWLEKLNSKTKSCYKFGKLKVEWLQHHSWIDYGKNSCPNTRLMVISYLLTDTISFVFRLLEKALPRSWPFSTRRGEPLPSPSGLARSTPQRIWDTRAPKPAEPVLPSTKRLSRPPVFRRRPTTSSQESSLLPLEKRSSSINLQRWYTPFIHPP